MAERRTRQPKESPADLFAAAQAGFNECIMGEYDAGALRTSFEGIRTSGNNAAQTPDQLYPLLVTQSRLAAQKAGLSNDLETVGYFSGLADAFQTAYDMLSSAPQPKAPQAPRSMTQPKA